MSDPKNELLLSVAGLWEIATKSKLHFLQTSDGWRNPLLIG